MIRRTHQVAPLKGKAARGKAAGQASWALSALLLTLAGCTVECHSSTSTSHSTGSSSGSERTVAHEPHEQEHHEPRPQSGRGDVVRVVSTEKHTGGEPAGHNNGRGGDGTRHVVQPSGSAPPNHSEPERGTSSDGQGGGADSAGAAGASAGADSSGGASPADSGASGDASSDQPAAAGKKPRTPSNKRESEPHVARPVKRAGVNKSEGREDNEAPANKGSGK